MSKTITVRKPTKEAVERANTLSRETYKTIKHMDKIALAAYLDRVYAKGYSDGFSSAKAVEEAPASEQDAKAPAEE